MELKNKVLGFVAAAALTLSMGAAAVAEDVPAVVTLTDGACTATLVDATTALNFNYEWNSVTNSYTADLADRSGTFAIEVTVGAGDTYCDFSVSSSGLVGSDWWMGTMPETRLRSEMIGQAGNFVPGFGFLGGQLESEHVVLPGTHDLTIIAENNLPAALYDEGTYSGTITITSGMGV